VSNFFLFAHAGGLPDVDDSDDLDAFQFDEMKGDALGFILEDGNWSGEVLKEDTTFAVWSKINSVWAQKLGLEVDSGTMHFEIDGELHERTVD